MKILITDPAYKHAIALSRYLKTYDPSLEIIGASTYAPRFPWLFSRYYDRFITGRLEDIISCEPHELFIPVGNSSVEVAAALNLKTAVLPPQKSLQIALNKGLTLDTAKRLGIPTPKTFTPKSMDELDVQTFLFPCVVKGTMEAGKNVVSYPSSLDNLKRDVANVLTDPSQRELYPVIQEYVPGVGLGFFGFYQQGVLKRFYMHQRVREFPITGGASTAAKTIFHEEAFYYGKSLLDELKWHGPAMVEFKFDPLTNRLALMEINPKFWGSTELGLAAGINFGELLLRTIRGENLTPKLSPDSYKNISFCWPFEGDIAAVIQSRCWSGFKDYWAKGCLTNARSNGFLLNSFRLAEFLKAKA